MLNGKQKRYLRSLAQTDKAIFQIGKDGLSDNLAEQVGNALKARELVKISVLKTGPVDLQETAFDLAMLTKSEVVQIIGRTIILYKQAKEPKNLITMIIEGTFDPITESELEKIKQIRYKKQCRSIYIKVNKKESLISYEDRVKMVQKAIAPYRYMKLVYKGSADLELKKFLNEEKEVREGQYIKAAKGLRKYIAESGIYLKQTVDAMCKPKRAIHSQGVADTAVLLAKWHSLDVNRAYKMGMLHDVTKILSEAEGKKILSVWDRKDLVLDPKIWHSKTAVFVLKHQMGITDSKILNAIWNHTTGYGKSNYARVLYIADKIEPNRGYDTTIQMHLAKKNLKEASFYILKDSKRYIQVKEGKNV